jgi:hypothetical protein
MDREVRVNVLVDAHACDADSAADALNVPALEAVHSEMCVRVSDVPPFVHGPTDDEAAFDPPDADAIVACFRVASPTAAAVAPAEPGSAVCSFAQQVAVANVPSNHPFTTELANPTVIQVLLR